MAFLSSSDAVGIIWDVAVATQFFPKVNARFETGRIVNDNISRV